MLSNFIAQWENANLAAFQLFGKVVAQSANPAGLAGAAADVGAWRALVRTVLQTSQQYANAAQSAGDESWRTQRDRLGLKNSATAVKELAAIHADLATRIAQGHVQHAGALADATAQYLDNVSRSRNSNDASMALGTLAQDVQAQGRSHALHVAMLAGGLQPALVQWAEKHLADDTTEQQA
ncbi:hypothetical protein [Paraburkholderia sp.]|uniref:hypothetical protein n=1 Tax=Paraburkholderia sp. TaxID=1926495 RepID=UPI003D6F34F7